MSEKTFQHAADPHADPEAIERITFATGKTFTAVYTLPETVFSSVIEEPLQTFVDVRVVCAESQH